MTTDELIDELRHEVVKVRREVQALRTTLATFIAWASGSANSPINHAEATDLLRMVHPPEPDDDPSGGT